MIGLFIAVQMAAATAPPHSSKIRPYHECVEQKALEFERARESVAQTVDGAFAACQGERALLILDMADRNGKAGGRVWSGTELFDFVTTVIDAELRGRVTAKLFSIRAERP